TQRRLRHGVAGRCWTGERWTVLERRRTAGCRHTGRRTPTGLFPTGGRHTARRPPTGLLRSGERHPAFVESSDTGHRLLRRRRLGSGSDRGCGGATTEGPESKRTTDSSLHV